MSDKENESTYVPSDDEHLSSDVEMSDTGTEPYRSDETDCHDDDALEKEVDAPCCNCGYNVVHFAVINDQLELLKYVMTDNTSYLEAKDNSGLTPLFMAVKENRYEVAKYLLGQGANPNVSTSTSQAYVDEEGVSTAVGLSVDTPLLSAVGTGYNEMVTLLLDHGANVNGGVGDKPLHKALEAGHLDVFQTLMRYGANVNARSGDGNTVLHLAVYNELVDFVKELFTNDELDTDLWNHDGETALHLAVAFHLHNMVELLLEYSRVDINRDAKNGDTALHYAVDGNDKEMVVYLIHKGADLDVKNKEDLTANNYAEEDKNQDMLTLLTYCPTAKRRRLN